MTLAKLRHQMNQSRMRCCEARGPAQREALRALQRFREGRLRDDLQGPILRAETRASRVAASRRILRPRSAVLLRARMSMRMRTHTRMHMRLRVRMRMPGCPHRRYQ